MLLSNISGDTVTYTGRRSLILGVWGLGLFALTWSLVNGPPVDDEYTKWLFFGVLVFGVPWFLDLSLGLLIAFSLERRYGTTRRWILAIWTATLVCLTWLHVFREAALGPFDAPNTYMSWLTISFQVFAFPELFILLAALFIVLWLERKISERSLTRDKLRILARLDMSRL